MPTKTFLILAKQMLATGDSPMALRNSIKATMALIDIEAYCKQTGVEMSSLTDGALSSLYQLSTNSEL